MDGVSAAVLCASFVALGAIVIVSTSTMRSLSLSGIEWLPPETPAHRQLPLHAFHLRLHELEPLKRDTVALHAAVGYAASVPVLVRDTQASEQLVLALGGDSRACVVSGKLCRIAARPPQTATGDDGAAATRRALEKIGTPGILLWFSEGEDVQSTALGEVAVGAREAAAAVIAFSPARLLVLHDSRVRSRGCP